MALRMSCCMIAIAHLPDKSSVADPLPVSMLKGVSNLLTPFLTHLFTSCFPASFKDSFLTLVLRKPGLDEASPSSYRPISNLSIISKLLHRLIVQQFVAYLNASRLLPATESGFRRGHSTETAIIRVLSDLLDAVDRDDTAISSCSTSPRRLTPWVTEFCWRGCGWAFGVDNSALVWFRFYPSAVASALTLLMSFAVYHRVRSLGRYFSLSTPLTSNRSFQSMACGCVSTLTIAIMAPADHLLFPHCQPPTQRW